MENNFKEIFKDTCISVELKSDTKEGIIEEMIDLLVAAGKIRNRAEALAAVLAREEKMSTGMQYGVAVPHGKIQDIDGLATAFAIKKEGVDFSSLDGEPSRIFVMTVSSVNETGPHIQYLAAAGKLLTNPKVRERLLNAGSAEDVIEIMAS